MTTMKPLVTTEPLVDYVEHTAIVTDVCPIIVSGKKGRALNGLSTATDLLTNCVGV